MKILIRADASITLGMGHIMRCLTLAAALKKRGHAVHFVTRLGSGNGENLILKQGFTCTSLPESELFDADHDAVLTRDTVRKTFGMADILIVDHYGLAAPWEQSLRPAAIKILALDDQANRLHDADWLLDQNYFRDAISRYEMLVPQYCQRLCGPQFALLRGDFARVHLQARPRSGPVQRILISYGGPDATGETLKSLEALCLIGFHDAVDCVIGASNPRHEKIAMTLKKLPQAQLHVQTDRMAELMLCADLALGAAGTTTWERCCVGLPTIVTVVAENQRFSAQDLAQDGIIELAGEASQLDAPTLARHIQKLMADEAFRNEQSSRSLQLVDGTGCDKVLQILGA